MRWLWIGLAVILVVAAGSAWFAFQRPDFVAGLVAIAGAAVVKAAMPTILKRMPPEQEEAYRRCLRRGGEWDNRLKRCRDRTR